MQKTLEMEINHEKLANSFISRSYCYNKYSNNVEAQCRNTEVFSI